MSSPECAASDSTPSDPENNPAASFRSVIAAAANIEWSATRRFSAENAARPEAGGPGKDGPGEDGLETAVVMAFSGYRIFRILTVRRCTARRSRTYTAARRTPHSRHPASAPASRPAGGNCPPKPADIDMDHPHSQLLDRTAGAQSPAAPAGSTPRTLCPPSLQARRNPE